MSTFEDLVRRVARLELRETVLRDVGTERVLKVLRDFAKSPLNDGTLWMTPDTLGNATGLDAYEVVTSLIALIHAGFVESVGVGWRITEDGIWALP